MKNKHYITKFLIMILTFLTLLAEPFLPLAVFAQTDEKPIVRLDIRSEKQAILTIRDKKLQTAQETAYHIWIGDYNFQLRYLPRIPDTYGELYYFDVAVNQGTYFAQKLTDGVILQQAKLTDEQTLTLMLDLTRVSEAITEAANPEKLLELNFFELKQNMEFKVQYDGEKNNYQETEYAYSANEFYYDKMKGLTFTIPPEALEMFDKDRDYGHVVGLTPSEAEQLFFTPDSPQYLITLEKNSRRSYSYLADDFEGTADVYTLYEFDEQGALLRIREKHVYDSQDAYLADFRNIETTPDLRMLLAKFYIVWGENPDIPTGYLFTNQTTILQLQKSDVDMQWFLSRAKENGILVEVSE